jgi:cobalt-zinc-cadmium efflux system outer membrane protein
MRKSAFFLIPALVATGPPALSGAHQNAPSAQQNGSEAHQNAPSAQQNGSEAQQNAPSAQQAYTLEDPLRVGREVNPTLLSLRAGHAASEANRRDAGRFPNPELEYEAGEGELFESPGTWSLSEISLRQAIQNPLARHHRLAAVQLGVDAAQEQVRFGEVQVDYEVRLHFYGILLLQERLRLARLNEEALKAIRGLIEARAAVGEVRELEAIRLRVEHLRAQNETQAAELELDQLRRELNTFLGNSLPEDFSLAGELASDLMVPELDRLEREVLPGHPELLEAARRREAADHIRRAAGVGWIPDPVLSASSGKELDGDILKFGIGIQIPLWNQSRAAAERERQTVVQLERQEEALLLGLQAELMIHHNHLRMHRRTLLLFQEGLLAEAEASMEIAEVSYREGEISFLEYLDSRRTYQSIQIEYQQALFDWNREWAELDRAVGGGIL